VYNKITEEQKIIINSKHKRVNVNAGSGSGKTTTLCCYAIKQAKQLIKDTPLWVHDKAKVLFVSLTNKAMDEAEIRTMQLMKDENTSDVMHKIEFSTIHSFANRQLRRYKQPYKNSSIKVVDNDDIEDRLNTILANVKPDWKDNEFILSMMRKLSHYNNGDLKGLIKQKHPAFANHVKTILKVLNKLSKIKSSENLITFDDMIYDFYEMLKQDSIREKIIKKYPVIIVDEFQDTGSMQWKIIKNMIDSESHLLCAGDDGQTIFTWDQASFFRFKHFDKRFPKGMPYPLNVNVRSTKQIMALSNALIKQSNYAARKTMQSFQDGPKPKINLHDNPYILYEYIVNEIKHHINNGGSGKDIGIIYRFYKDAYCLKNYLLQNGIPFKVMGDKAKKNRPVVKFIFPLIKIIDGKSNDGDWEAVLLKVDGAGKRNIKAITDWIKNKDPDETIYPKNNLKFVKPLQQLLEIISTIRKSKADNQDKLEQIIKYSEKLPKLNYPQIQHILPTLYNLTKESRSLSDIIDKYYDLSYPFYYPGVFEPPYPHLDDYVTLSTVHRIKGGEFNTVFYLGTDDTMYEKYKLFVDKKKIESELQIMNVAVTRARRDLHMLFPISPDIWDSQDEACNPWTFIKRAGENLCDMVSMSDVITRS
jgi:DNA helicase-2/ATP-dependent DNA helicase PcrA